MSVCTICTDVLHRDLLVIGCGHVFHSACLVGWFSIHRSCPNCKQTGLSITNLHINPENLLHNYVDSHHSEAENPWENLKLAALKLKLRLRQGEKAAEALDIQAKQLKHNIHKAETKNSELRDKLSSQAARRSILKRDLSRLAEVFHPLSRQVKESRRSLTLVQLKYIKLFQHFEAARAIRNLRNSFSVGDFCRPEDFLPRLALRRAEAAEPLETRERELQARLKAFVISVQCRWIDQQNRRIAKERLDEAKEGRTAEARQALVKILDQWRKLAEKRQLIQRRKQALMEEINAQLLERKRNIALRARERELASRNPQRKEKTQTRKNEENQTVEKTTSEHYSTSSSDSDEAPRRSGLANRLPPKFLQRLADNKRKAKRTKIARETGNSIKQEQGREEDGESEAEADLASDDDYSADGGFVVEEEENSQEEEEESEDHNEDDDEEEEGERPLKSSLSGKLHRSALSSAARPSTDSDEEIQSFNENPNNKTSKTSKLTTAPKPVRKQENSRPSKPKSVQAKAKGISAFFKPKAPAEVICLDD